MITKPTIWTAERVLSELTLMLEEIRLNKTIVYLGEIFEERPYPRQLFSVWGNDYKDDKQISDTIKRIDDILESRINLGGLKGKLNPALTIFNLKNNYDWKEKTEIDSRVQSENININTEFDSEDVNIVNIVKEMEAKMRNQHSNEVRQSINSPLDSTEQNQK